MNDEQIEQIRQKVTINFPCDNYVIRIIGINSDNFISKVMQIMRTKVADLDERSLVIRTSKNAKYITAQLSIRAQSLEHLQEINHDLLASKIVQMVL